MGVQERYRKLAGTDIIFLARMCKSAVEIWLKNSYRHPAMAASSEDGILVQLAALLGTREVHIRKTCEIPPRISVIDVIKAIAGKDNNHAAEAFRRGLH